MATPSVQSKLACKALKKDCNCRSLDTSSKSSDTTENSFNTITEKQSSDHASFSINTTQTNNALSAITISDAPVLLKADQLSQLLLFMKMI